MSEKTETKELPVYRQSQAYESLRDNIHSMPDPLSVFALTNVLDLRRISLQRFSEKGEIIYYAHADEWERLIKSLKELDDCLWEDVLSTYVFRSSIRGDLRALRFAIEIYFSDIARPKAVQKIIAGQIKAGVFTIGREHWSGTTQEERDYAEKGLYAVLPEIRPLLQEMLCAIRGILDPNQRREYFGDNFVAVKRAIEIMLREPHDAELAQLLDELVVLHAKKIILPYASDGWAAYAVNQAYLKEAKRLLDKKRREELREKLQPASN